MHHSKLKARRACRFLASLALGSSLILGPSAAFGRDGAAGLVDRLLASAPNATRNAVEAAVAAMQCAAHHGGEVAQRLAVIDYSLPSSAKRLWIFDLENGSLVLEEFVAHGKASGNNFAETFSNRNGSNQSSLGLFVAAETYHGIHGYSLRLDGLEPGINDNARERAIVIHSADYVDPALVMLQGRIGRSLGCPAVRPEVGRMVVDNLKGGQYVFAWYPQEEWLASSIYLNCDATRVAAALGTTPTGDS